MEPALGSLNTMTPAFDAKQKQNQNAANDRKLRNPNTPAERFVMPGQQQVQAMVNARQARPQQGQQQTFATMQQQGVARPAPPPPPAQGGSVAVGGQQPVLQQQVAQRLQQPMPVMQAQPGLQQQVQQAMQAQVPQQPVLPGQVQQALAGGVQPQQMQQPAQPSAAGSDLQQQLLAQLTQLSQAPSAYGTEQIQQMREAQRADIEAQFGAQRQQLEEDLARRGLSASSIAAGQFGDIAGQQARAIATAEAGLTERAAESLQRGREAAIQGLAQAAGVELQAKGLDLQSKKVQADIDSESKRLMQADRSLDLQQARDLAQNNIAMAQLAEQARSNISRENISLKQIAAEGDRFAAQLGLDRDRFQDQITARAEQLARQDRSLDQAEAQWMATEMFKREQFEEQNRQFDITSGMNAAQWDLQRQLIEAQLAQLFAQGAMPQASMDPITEYGYGSRIGSGGGNLPTDMIGGVE